MSGDIRIRHDLRVGDLGRIIALHGMAYSGLPGFGWYVRLTADF